MLSGLNGRFLRERTNRQDRGDHDNELAWREESVPWLELYCGGCDLPAVRDCVYREAIDVPSKAWRCEIFETGFACLFEKSVRKDERRRRKEPNVNVNVIVTRHKQTSNPS